MFINNKDKNNNFILREYSYTLPEVKSNRLNKDIDQAIWSNDFLIAIFEKVFIISLMELGINHQVWFKFQYLCFMILYQKSKYLDYLQLLTVKLKKYKVAMINNIKTIFKNS